MPSTFKFELVSPERVLLSGDASEAILPGSEGDFTVLVGHAPFISTLRPGIIEVVIGGLKRRVFVKSGFADVDPERATVLAEKAVLVEELDAGRLADEMAAAEAEIGEAKDDAARSAAEAALDSLRRLQGKAA